MSLKLDYALISFALTLGTDEPLGIQRRQENDSAVDSDKILGPNKTKRLHYGAQRSRSQA